MSRYTLELSKIENDKNEIIKRKKQMIPSLINVLKEKKKKTENSNFFILL